MIKHEPYFLRLFMSLVTGWYSSFVDFWKKKVE